MRIETGLTLMLAGVFCAGTMMAQTGGSGTSSPQTTGGQTSGTGTTTPSTGTAAGSAAGSAMATPDNINADPMTMGSYPSDVTFVKKAIMGNNAEIDTAKMALQKSQNQAVKDYAQKMIDDHTKMLDTLHTLAQTDNIKFEDKPTPMGQKLAAKLQTLDGPAFDKAYINGMVKDHKGDVKDFSTEINHGKKQDVKDAASQSLPIIKDHLQMVEGLQKQVG